MTISYLDSVWRSVLPEFREYINGIPYKSMTIQEALDPFREVKCLPKKYRVVRGNTTVQDVAYKTKQIIELFTSLRKGMEPESLNLPFRIRDRKKQLIDQLAIYKKGNIDRKNAYAEVAVGHYYPSSAEYNGKLLLDRISVNERVFYYWVEAAIAPVLTSTKDDEGKLEFIGCINETPALDGGMSYFQNGYYLWRNTAGSLVTAYGMRELLAACGFSTYINFASRRQKSILFVNLMTPCVQWQGSAGKTSIDLEPYQNLIAETVSKLAYKIPSLHGKGVHTRILGLGGIYRPFLKEFLRNRREEIKRNRSIAVKDRLTQSGVWYRVRPKMIAKGFRPRKRNDWAMVRRGFTKAIREVIVELWPDGSVTRESLGIVAKARAMLYINGQVLPVSFDSIEELARIKVTDMIIVEKEGITDVLVDVAQKYRIALVATQGKFTEYVKDLMKLVHRLGSINVCVLTDYDIDGINMWREANEKMGINIKRIGITREVVVWLRQNGYDINLEDVEEQYNPNSKLMGKEDDPYLQKKRIELDSIIQKVGADAFWKYIVYQLETEFPAPRDYRDIIPEPQPEDYYSEEIIEFNEYLAKIHKQAFAQEWEEIKESQLKQVNGLLQVDDEKNEIDKSLRPIVEENEGIQKIIANLAELRRSRELPKLKDNEA